MKNTKNGGLIAFFGLSDWFYSLTNDQQRKIKEYYSTAFTDPDNLDSRNVTSSASVSGFLWPIGVNAVSKKDLDIANIILNKALELSTDVISKHYCLLGLIDMFYKQRNIRSDAIDECKKYCLIDTAIAEDFLQAQNEEMASLSVDVKDEDTKAYLVFRGKGESHASALKKLGYPISEIAENTYTRLPIIPSFLRLAIIYEKESEIKRAIDICNLAIKLGLRESKDKDFTNRLLTLEKKIK